MLNSSSKNLNEKKVVSTTVNIWNRAPNILCGTPTRGVCTSSDNLKLLRVRSLALPLQQKREGIWEARQRPHPHSFERSKFKTLIEGAKTGELYFSFLAHKNRTKTKTKCVVLLQTQLKNTWTKRNTLQKKMKRIISSWKVNLFCREFQWSNKIFH